MRKCLCCFLILIMLFETSCMANDSDNKQWALKNTGQTINGCQGTEGIDINLVHRNELNSKKVIIALLDSGIDTRNQNIMKNIYKNSNEIKNNGLDDDHNGYIDDYIGWDFIRNDTNVQSLNNDNHGTNILSILVNLSKKNIGVLSDAKILPLKIMDSNTGDINKVIEAINYAENMGAKIVNCSWEMTYYNDNLFETIKSSKMLFICSAGNGGEMHKVYPAGFDLPNTISVASINSKGLISDFSNYGNAVEIAAPGENILVISTDGKMSTVRGTSFAVPYVTALGALIFNKNPDLSANEVKDMILNNATTISSLKDKVLSGGYVNYDRTLNSLKNL